MVRKLSGLTPVTMTTEEATDIEDSVIQPMTVAPSTNLPAAARKPLSISEIGIIGTNKTQSVARVTDELTRLAKANDLDEVGKLLGDILVKAKELDPKSLSKPGLFGFFKRKGQQVANRFTSVSTQLQQMTSEVDGKIAFFRAQIPQLERFHEEVRQFHDELGRIIEEMEVRIQWMKDNPPAIDPNDPFSAQERQKWDQVIVMAEKRAHDLRLSMTLAQQQAPQIQQNIVNAAALAQKFDDVKTVTLPAWKNLFSLYIVQLQQKKGAEMALAIDEATSKAIRSGADMLHQNTTAIHTALNQGSIKFEDLEYNQQKLLESIETAQRLAKEAAERRAAERPKIEELNRNLQRELTKLSGPTAVV